MKSEIVNILHLSDFHFNRKGKSVTLNAQRKNALDSLLKKLETISNDWKPHIIVISGDIGWAGKEEDYDLANIWISNLLQALNLSPNNLIICAGNHDIDRDRTFNCAYPSSRNEADDWLKVERLESLCQYFEYFTKFLDELKVPKLFLGEFNNYLVGYRRISDINFIVLNSAWFSYREDDAHKLWLGLNFLRVMEQNRHLPKREQYNKNNITIAVFHHPQEWLSDSERIGVEQRKGAFYFLAERCHIMLSGHLHGEMVMEPDTKAQRAKVFVGGASYFNERYSNNFSIFQINKKERFVSRKVFTYDPYDSTWKEHSDIGRYHLLAETFQTQMEKIGHDSAMERVLELTKQTYDLDLKESCSWFVEGVPHSEDVETAKCLKHISQLVEKDDYKKALQVSEDSLTLTISPLHKLTFLQHAGDCSYLLGRFNDAEKYYHAGLLITERKKLQEIYGEILNREKAKILDKIGLVHHSKGELGSALEHFEAALEIDKAVGYKRGEATVLSNIGAVHFDKGALDTTLKYYQAALEIDKAVGYRQGEATVLGAIGLIHWSRGELDTALEHLQAALEINKAIGYKRGEATELNSIGRVYFARGELDVALEHFEAALEIDKAIGHSRGEAIDLGNIGTFHFDKGALDTALEHYQAALEICKAIGYRRGEATAMGNIGSIYLAKSKFDAALEHFQAALEIDKAIGYRRGEATDLSNIGSIYHAKSKFDAALEHFQAALEIDKAIGYRRGETTDLSHIGSIYYAKSKFDSALEHFQAALEIDKAIGYRRGEATDLSNIGSIYLAKSKFDAALKYLSNALEIFRKYNLTKEIETARNTIRKIQKLQEKKKA